MPDVVITLNRADIGAAIDEALGAIAFEPLVAGKRVAVKPNDTWASKDDTTGITQPDTLRAVLRAIKRHGPRELVVTGGAGSAETDEVFRLGGLMDVVDEEGAEFFDHNRPPFVSVDLEYAPRRDVRGPQQSIMVNPRVRHVRTPSVMPSESNSARLKPRAPSFGVALESCVMRFPR
jgi:hypothetical protein